MFNVTNFKKAFIKALTARISHSANSYLKLSLFKKLLLNRYKSGLNFKFYFPWF